MKKSEQLKVLVGVFVILILVVLVFSVIYGVKVTGKSTSLSSQEEKVGSGIGKSIPVNGNHYNLNIIGVKTAGQVGDSSGHTLFVPLNGKTKIIMTQATDGVFQVTDRNGLDGSASFNIAPGKYNIYATGLGKPGGSSRVDAWGEFTDAQDGTVQQLLGYVNIERAKGTPKTVNINNLFFVDVTLCLEVNSETEECSKSVVYNDYWVFDIEELLSYWWEYNNQGLKLLQVRFYSCTLDPTGTASDYCRWGDGSPITSSKTIIDAM